MPEQVKRPTIEVDLEVYLALRKLGTIAGMRDCNCDACEVEDEYYESALADSVVALITADASNGMTTSEDWVSLLPPDTLKYIEAQGHVLNFPEFNHEGCDHDEEDEGEAID